MTAQDYFAKLYTVDDQINIYTPQVSETAGAYMPSNYSEYNEFIPPKNLRHLLIRPQTLDQEIKKKNNAHVLKKLQAQISNDWETSVN